MADTVGIDDDLEAAQSELAAACADLSRLTGLPPPALHPADRHAHEPPLFVYGILGGKDVGKTTLINALAESRISQEDRSIGPGTHVPVVYVHREDAPVLRDRLAADPGLEYELVTHDRSILRHVVLVDLPDFDSKRNLPDHARRAAAFKPYFDAFLWVTTVRKIDHPELLRQMLSVAPKKENFYCVVSFADEVIQSGKDSLEGLRQLCLAKLRRLYFDDYDPANLFVVCTLEAQLYDFPALHHRLVRRHSTQEISQRRQRNALHSCVANIQLVRSHFGLDQAITGLRILLEELPQRFAENLPAEYWQAVTERIGRLDGPYRRMAARLFAHRIWGWPILSALLFPLSAAVSYLGGLLFFETGSRWSDYHQLNDLLTIDGLGLKVRLQRVSSELRAKFLRLHQAFGARLTVETDVSAELEGWVQWLDEQDRKALERLQAHYTRPHLLKRCLVYLPILWFPLVQPVLQEYLSRPAPSWGEFFRGLGLTLVSFLSAGYVLRSAAVLLVVYLLWLLWFYASSARVVARQRLSGFEALRQTVLEPGLMDRLRAPYDYLLDELAQLDHRLAGVTERLGTQLEAQPVGGP